MKLRKKISLWIIISMMLNHTALFSHVQDVRPAIEAQAVLCDSDCSREHIAINEYNHLVALIRDIVDTAIARGQAEELCPGLLDCYVSLAQGKQSVHLDSLCESLPVLFQEIIHSDRERAPRPDAQGIVSPGTCDLSEVISLLHALEHELSVCCQANSEILTTLTTCCENMTLNFEGTFTTLNAISDLITVDFNATFTVLASLLDTTTACCAQNQTNFNGTFTTLNSISSLLRAEYCNPTLITQAYYNALPAPKTLTTGNYRFAENITYTPGVAANPGLTLSGPGISLDLGCFTFRQANTVPGVNGIQISNNANDVEIKNGMIRDFSGEAIQFNATTLERPYIHDITILDSGEQGLRIISSVSAGAIDGTIENIEIMHTGTSIGVATTQGIGLVNCNNFIVNNVRVAESGNTTAGFQGISAQDVNNSQITNAVIANNIGDFFNGVALFGSLNNRLDTIMVNQNNVNGPFNGVNLNISAATGVTSDSNMVSNVMVADNTTASAAFTGFLSTSSACVIDNVMVSGNITTGANLANRGFVFANGANGNMITNCSYTSNIGTATVIGYNFTGADNVFEKCSAIGNTAIGSTITHAYGFGTGLISTINNTFVDCIAEANISNLTTDGSLGAAGFVLTNAVGSRCIRCLAADHVATTTSKGFELSASTNMELNDCQAINQTIGYDITGATSPVLYRNFASRNNQNYAGFPVGSTQQAATIADIETTLTNPWINIAIG